MIDTILLLPAEGDPHGLCREGVFGARPPMMWRTDPSHVTPPGYDSGAVGWSDPSKVRAPLGAPGPYHGPYGDACYRLPQQWALVLYHDGQPVEEGLFCASVAMESAPDWMPSDALGHYSPWECTDLESVLYRAEWLEERGIGTIICLDAGRREVPRG